MTPARDSADVLFAWEKPWRFRWRLFGLFVLSLAVHVLTFFVFGITWPPRVTIPPPAPEVSLLLPTTAENRALLRRIEAEDPALVAGASSVAPPVLAEVRYHASYELIRTQPRTIPEKAAPPPTLAPREPLAIIRSGTASAPAAAVAPQAPRPTRLRFSASLEQRAPPTPPAWNLAPRAAVPLAPASFLLGVNDRGETRYVFLQRSSGDPALDQQASVHVSALTFASDPAPIAWGVATIIWGDDAFELPPRSP